MNETTRFNTLMEFIDMGLYASENIVKELTELCHFDHDDLIEQYDEEDKAYYITMHCNLNSDEKEIIKEYLDNHGCEGKYAFYNRYAN